MATVSAKTAGLPPAATAMDTAKGTSNTVAPTFDITKVKTVAIIATPTCKPQIGQPSKSMRTCCAIQAAVPVVWTATPSGIRLANRNTVFQLTAS